MGRYQPYADYKYSGVSWLGPLPSDWEAVRVKFVADLVNEKVEPDSDDRFIGLENVSSWTGRYLGPAEAAKPEGISNRYYPDCVLFGKLRPYLAKSLRVADQGICSSEFLVLRSRKVISRFLQYFTLTDEFIRQVDSSTYGAKMPRASWEFVSSIPTPVPSVNEQEVIAAFLDHETTKIDHLIAKQERLIELLKEKRQAVISHAVRSSGNFEPVKLGYFIDLLPGYAFPSASFSHDDTDMPLLRGINVGVDEIRWDETVYWPKGDYAHLHQFALKPGDLVFGMDRPWISDGARVAAVSQADVPCLLLQRVCRLRARKGLVQKFLKLILSSQEFKDYVEADLTGVSVPHISPDQIGSFRLRLPSEERQRLVCESIAEQFKRIRATTSKAEEAIRLMREHRTGLISAAVTGKIDVRGWQKPNNEPQEAATAASI